MKIIRVKAVLLQCHAMCRLFIMIGAMSSVVLCGKTLSFNVLFPMSWYEKGLNATVSVWHKMCSVIDDIDNNYDSEIDAFDIILGRFAFAHFCLEKMYQQKQSVIDEDMAYLIDVLHAIEMRLIENSQNMVTCPHFVCLTRMVERTKRLLHPPSDF